jgi:ABC-type transporter Mla MlaB component
MHDHACWIYEDDGERREAVVEYFADGLRAEQRLLYVGSDPAERLREDLARLDGAESLIADGALQVLSLGGVEVALGRDDAERRLEAYGTAAEQAVADGYTGLRVAVAVTGLRTDPEAHEAHTLWESLVDRAIVARPMTALCMYDRREVPERMLADLACVHPASHSPAGMVPFRVFSRPDGLVLEGEVDYFSAADLGRVLDITLQDDGEVLLDLGGLGFVDHHGVMALAERARGMQERDGLRFQNVPHPVMRLTEVMGVTL